MPPFADLLDDDGNYEIPGLLPTNYAIDIADNVISGGGSGGGSGSGSAGGSGGGDGPLSSLPSVGPSIPLFGGSGGSGGSGGLFAPIGNAIESIGQTTVLAAAAVAVAWVVTEGGSNG